MAADIATLGIRVDSQGVAKAEKGLDALEKSGRRAERATDGLTSAFNEFRGVVAGALTGVTIGAAFKVFVSDVSKAGVEIQRFSQLANASTEDFQRIAYGAQTVQVSQEKLADILKDVNEKIGEFVGSGTGEMKDFFEEIAPKVGVTADQFAKLSGPEALQLYYDSLQKAGLSQQRMTTYMEALANDATVLIPLLRDGGRGFQELGEEADRAGAVMDQTLIRDAAEFDRMLIQLDATMQGVKFTIGQEIIPVINDLAGQFLDARAAGLSFFEAFTRNGNGALTTAQNLAVVEKQIADLHDTLSQRGAFATRLGDVGILEGNQAELEALQRQKQYLINQLEREQKSAASLESLGRTNLAGSAGSSRSTPRSRRRATDGIDRAAAAAERRRRQEFEGLVESLRSEEEAIADSYAKRRAIIEANTGAGSADRSNLIGRLDADRAEQLKRLEEQRGAELESLRKSLLTEEESIQESYDRRLAIVRENLGEESTLRADMESRLASERDTALKAIEEKRASERESLYNGLLTEEEALRQSYERKKALILESEAVTEMERQDLLRRLQEQFATEQHDMEMKRIQTQLGAAESLFGALAGLAKAYGGEQSKAYRALFAVSKAFSIANATMAIADGISQAQKLGYPMNLVESARVAAVGAAQLAQINSANFSGAYDEGGRIPAGKIGLVGEYGPEFVRGPANVTSRKDTAKMLEGGSGPSQSAPAPQVNVRNINVLDPSLVGDYLATDAGEQLIMNVVQRNQQALGY